MAQVSAETTAKNKKEILKGLERWHTGTGSFLMPQAQTGDLCSRPKATIS